MPSAETIDAANLFIATFAARADAYSVWVPKNNTWTAIREPLTAEVLLPAFMTPASAQNVDYQTKPVSGYMLGVDSRTHVAALDIDRPDGMELGKRFASTLSDLGGIGYLESSRRGCHFWIVLDAPRPGVLIRRALKALMAEAELPLDPKIELRPASDRLSGPEALGHCLRMPTMPHQKTGLRYVLVSSDGEKLPSKLAEMMREIAFTPAKVFDSAAERAPLPPLDRPPAGLRFPFGLPTGTESASEILRDLYGVQDARPRHNSRCPIHGEDRNPSLSVLADDQRVICRVPGCTLNNDGRGRGTHELRAMAPRERA